MVDWWGYTSSMRVRILLTPKLCHLLYYSTEAGVHTPASFSCLLNISTVPTFESRQLWITAWHLGRYIVLMQKHFYHICFVSNLLHAKMTFFKINFIDWCVSVTVLLILINFFEKLFIFTKKSWLISSTQNLSIIANVNSWAFVFLIIEKVGLA